MQQLGTAILLCACWRLRSRNKCGDRGMGWFWPSCEDLKAREDWMLGLEDSSTHTSGDQNGSMWLSFRTPWVATMSSDTVCVAQGPTQTYSGKGDGSSQPWKSHSLASTVLPGLQQSHSPPRFKGRGQSPPLLIRRVSENFGVVV